MAANETIEQTILEEARRTRSRVEELSAFLSPNSSTEDPIEVLTGALAHLTEAVREQTLEIGELRAEIAALSLSVQGSG